MRALLLSLLAFACAAPLPCEAPKTWAYSQEPENSCVYQVPIVASEECTQLSWSIGACEAAYEYLCPNGAQKLIWLDGESGEGWITMRDRDGCSSYYHLRPVR